MKKLLLSILIGFTAITCFAQEHLTFKGIPIDGTKESMIQKLKGAGLTYSERLSSHLNTPVFKGSFAGLDDCSIFILYDNARVWKIGVTSDDFMSWFSLKSKYESLKQSLINKYGVSPESFEFFESPYYEGDGYELQALRNQKCTWASYFKLPNGFITIELSTTSSDRGHLTILYEDLINSEKHFAEKDKEIESDL